MIRLLICDDQVFVREGLAAILSTAPGIEVVGLAQHGQEAVALVAHHQPDLVLMDLKMPVLNGVRATQQIRKAYPQVQVLVLTTYAEDGWLFDAVRAGAAGYLLKDIQPEDLIKAIVGTVAGQSHLDPTIAGKILAQANQNRSQASPVHLAQPLLPREEEILIMVAQGLSNPEIGERLHLAPGTVRNYLSEIFNKLGVFDRVQAAVIAVRLGLLDKI